jgi:hypothetical protein
VCCRFGRKHSSLLLLVGRGDQHCRLAGTDDETPHTMLGTYTCDQVTDLQRPHGCTLTLPTAEADADRA